MNASYSNILSESLDIAAEWQERSKKFISSDEKRYQRQFSGLRNHPIDKFVLFSLLDQSFRSDDSFRVADQVKHIFKKYGIPSFFNLIENQLTEFFNIFGKPLAPISVPLFINQVQSMTKGVILPGEIDLIKEFIRKKSLKENVYLNLNHLGEEVLGHQEANKRLKGYLDLIQLKEVSTISVKISTLYAKVNSLAFDHTVRNIVNQLVPLLKEADRFQQRDKEKVKDPRFYPQKFVNLDMEEYRDLEITKAAFMKTLNHSDLKQHQAGIVLQAYIPDSFEIQREITEWAKERVKNGGAPIKIRIVKGANLEMEAFQASVQGWEQAPYSSKLEVDANYKRMVEYGLQPENVKAAKIGIASHNLFEVAYAYRFAKEMDVLDFVIFEMLHGMAQHTQKVLLEKNLNLLLYSPITKKEDFVHAIAYLTRRLDENTGKDNFMSYIFDLDVGSQDWNHLQDLFVESNNLKDQVNQGMTRTQNRLTELHDLNDIHPDTTFTNEPDTDFILRRNRDWANQIVKKWMPTETNKYEEIIPVVVAGEELLEGRDTEGIQDRNQLELGDVATYTKGSRVDVLKSIEIAKKDPDQWRETSLFERKSALLRVANQMRNKRAELIGSAMLNTGKIISEADVEVSEAIDFAEFYARTVTDFENLDHLEAKPKGVGVVISPWNFPLAIPAGGVLAALAAGNTCILKPAPEAVLAAWETCKCFWEAGISKNVLQFVPCDVTDGAEHYTKSDDVDFIVLTGGTETAEILLKQKPTLDLYAETGGKNATIVTAMADRDKAIKDVIQSAFSNSGQKCSATSLLILEKELFDDEGFKEQLKDAVESMFVGNSWELQTEVGPLIREPDEETLLKGFKYLEEGESWLVSPKMVNDNPYLWAPAVKWNVAPEGFDHQTEFFGPLLAVMRAENLDHAIDIANSVEYGLTTGIHSLDEREIEIWKEKIQAGNLYINRGTTGAIVLRQPFGGIKKSCFGFGMKAGGVNYVAQFMKFTAKESTFLRKPQFDSEVGDILVRWKDEIDHGKYQGEIEDIAQLIRVTENFLYWNETLFSQEIDHFHLRGQDNICRYKPIGKILIRLHEKDNVNEIMLRILATKLTGNEFHVSSPMPIELFVEKFESTFLNQNLNELVSADRLHMQSDQELIEAASQYDRIVYIHPSRVPDSVLKKVTPTGIYITKSPVYREGRVELLKYLREESVSHDYHRYGNLGLRSSEFEVI